MLGFLFDSLFVEQTDFGFNSQREESEFGLYDYKARYYSPLLGRFISADSIVPDFSNPQSLNRYAYVYNNPLRYTDPTGHCLPIEACLVDFVLSAGAAVHQANEYRDDIFFPDADTTHAALTPCARDTQALLR